MEYYNETSCVYPCVQRIHRRGTSPTKMCKLQLGDPSSTANCVLLLLRKDINSRNFSMLW